jgi:site-specific DNA-methyltransferase (adenine-specific)
MKPYYEDELVTLYHGDALEVTEWLSADVLVTDPPYGVAWKGGFSSYSRTGRKVFSNDGIANDEDAGVRDAVLAIWGKKPAVVFGSWRVARPKATNHRLIWWKRGMSPGPVNSAFMTQDEEIYILGDGFMKSSPPMRSVISTDESRSQAVATIGHPTPKPVGLMEQLIARCPDGIIADPFAGSGATLVAARNLGRRVIGVELEERYCEIIANRLSQQAFDFSELD